MGDGVCWEILPVDPEAAVVVTKLSQVMHLQEWNASGYLRSIHKRRLLVSTNGSDLSTFSLPDDAKGSSAGKGILRCVLPVSGPADPYSLQMIHISGFVAREAQALGGVLLHGALLCRDGVGVVLAAPGGTGKTTACGRIPLPWRSLCDDATLVVRNPGGGYLAHPWPTWSRFFLDGPGGCWEVEQAVPLGGIFFLSRSENDGVEPVGEGKAVSLLAENARQGSHLTSRGLGKEETRALHLERFNNLCALTKSVRTHLLHISMTGYFWREIEGVLSSE
jgi:SynChlorMet cassette protein ScmC